MSMTLETEKMGHLHWVGTRPVRPDGVDKVTGRAKFGAAIARMALSAISEPVEVADICLCGQEAPDADFSVLARFALEGFVR